MIGQIAKHQLFALSLIALCGFATVPAFAQDGDQAPPGAYLNSTPDSVPDPAPEPVAEPAPREKKQKFKPLQGGIEQSELQGDAQDNVLNGGASDFDGNAMQGMTDQSQPLQGGANDGAPLSGGVDEDQDGGELSIAWDQWRNTLMQTIQMGTLKNINVHNDIHFVFDPRTQMMQSRYPMGTSVWYAISVLPNRKIINLRLTQRSEFPSYDQAVVDAINALQGNKILTYPKGSKRKIVSQEASVSTAAQNNFQNFNFNDVERQQY